MKKVLFIFAFLFILASCDETNSPSSDYLIEKNVTPSLEEQVIESGSDFKMIFPANSISSNLEVKVKKEGSVPAMSIPNLKAGKNFYRIKFSGDVDFLKPVNIIINYDKSAIPAGKTAQESVFGYIYSSGSWKLADYQLDEPNGKIIISISSINGKTDKDEPILLDDGEMILGSFTPTDTGNKDDLLNSMIYYEGDLSFSAVINDNLSSPFGFSYDNLKSDTKGTITWGGNKFVIQENITRGAYQKTYQITGEVDTLNMILKNVAIVCEIVGTFSDYSTREFFTATFDNIQGDKLEWFDKSIWLYFDTAPYDDENKNKEIFKNSLKTISFKYTNTDKDGKVTEQTLKGIDWSYFHNHFYLYLYQTKIR
ncbi:MAG: hypothetical protein KIT33_02250 [Candidatus Kapabacteria bacterium]|nr:hypothetical protein [Ignavibacteriota bacterium]MCW5883771.1 hypothetical protein [Candidatus Kapabacteria bacterium]